MKLGPFGIWELAVIAVLVLLLFGPQKLPEIARGLSTALREFRKGLNEASRDLQDEFREAESATVKAPPAPAYKAPLPPVPEEETRSR